jgi:hypothetical protein
MPCPSERIGFYRGSMPNPDFGRCDGRHKMVDCNRAARAVKQEGAGTHERPVLRFCKGFKKISGRQKWTCCWTCWWSSSSWLCSFSAGAGYCGAHGKTGDAGSSARRGGERSGLSRHGHSRLAVTLGRAGCDPETAGRLVPLELDGERFLLPAQRQRPADVLGSAVPWWAFLKTPKLL